MTTRTTFSLALGTALLGVSLAGQAAGNPFAVQELSSGYNLVSADKAAEGSCGEAKCGAEMAAPSDATPGAEGSAGAAKMKEGSCGGDKAQQEGSCGAAKAGKQAEGSCGAKE